MRPIFALIFLFPFFLIAQQDAYHAAVMTQLQQDFGISGGTWILTPNEVTLQSQAATYGCIRTDSSITGQTFSQAMRLEVGTAGANPWDAGVFFNSQEPVQNGDILLITGWLRTPSEPAEVILFAEDAVSFSKDIYLGIKLSTSWQQFFVPVQAQDDYPAGDLNLGFHLASEAQTVELAGFNTINYGNTYTLSELPNKFPVRYAGDAPDAPWRTAAHQRISQHRMADMILTVQDGQGQALANQEVRVQMLRHEFGFGTAVTPWRLAGNLWNDPVYADHLLDLDGEGHGFNLVVTENALKWRAWEQFWAGTPAETINGLEWLASHDIDVRGHVLLWPAWNWMPADMQANSQDPGYMQGRISGHLNDILNRPEIRDIVREWDVINEISHVRDLEYALAGQPGFTTGREIYPWVFQQVESLDSNLVTYLNDYDILSNGSVNGNAYQLYKQMIGEIIADGGKVNGIGFQGHMSTSLIAPDSLYAILEDCFQEFGLPISITEYDLPKALPDEIEAQYLRDFLTLVFSHQAVDGFLMWGFWDGAHWKENAPLFYEDWSPKPALDTFVNLVFHDWWTDTTMMTNAQGEIILRGFKGEYLIEASSLGLNQKLDLREDTQTTLQLQAVSISRPDLPSPTIYPQPAHESVWIESGLREPWTLTILDPSGRTIRTWQASQSTILVDTGFLPDGLYLVQIETQNHQRQTSKMLIMR